MIDYSFPACGNCTHMRVIERDGKKCYFCPFVGDEIPNGLVDPTFDAFKCIRERRYSKKTC